MVAPSSIVISSVLAIELSCNVSTVAPALILTVGAYEGLYSFIFNNVTLAPFSIVRFPFTSENASILSMVDVPEIV